MRKGKWCTENKAISFTFSHRLHVLKSLTRGCWVPRFGVYLKLSINTFIARAKRKWGASFSHSLRHTMERSAEMASGLPRGAILHRAEGCYLRHSHGLAPHGVLTNCCSCKKLNAVSILLGKTVWKFSKRLYNYFPANQNLSWGGFGWQWK